MMTCRQMIYCFLFYSVVLCSICFPEASFMNLTSLSNDDPENKTKVNKSHVGILLRKESFSEIATDRTMLKSSNMTTDISTNDDIDENKNKSLYEFLKDENEYVMSTDSDHNKTFYKTESMIGSKTEVPILLNLSTQSTKSTEDALANKSEMNSSKARTSSLNDTSIVTEVMYTSPSRNLEGSIKNKISVSEQTKLSTFLIHNHRTIPLNDTVTKASKQKPKLHDDKQGTTKVMTTTPKHHRLKPYRHSYHQMLQHKTMHHLSLVPIEDGPFGSLVWKDKKYLISVLIPIAIGIIGAVCIIGMTYTARFCHKYELKLKDIKTSVSRQTQPCTDQITLLSDSDEV